MKKQIKTLLAASMIMQFVSLPVLAEENPTENVVVEEEQKTEDVVPTEEPVI